ncbi:glutamine synthetase family protein [Legionella sp. W05-934-2]|jgi:glutamine synthetase|uniref:glutamine synthetase family protein n=1 Tax=Legionella sp. W05-934-2 TaxID=1198649 RepID=UPI003461A058
MLSPEQVKTVEDAKLIVEQRQLSHVKVGICDMDGVLRGKYMHKDKFFSAIDKGFSFCDVVLGWDSKDKLYDNVQYTGWHTGYPDAPVQIIADSCRNIAFEEDQLLFLSEFQGEAKAICPRSVLKRVIKKANDMGFEPMAAFEYEFFLFDETPDSVREKGFRNLKTITPDFFGYSMIRNSVYAELYHDILNMSEMMRFPIEGLHTETGPGVIEAALVVDHALESADKAELFKTFMKVLAQRHHLMATFMAKWSSDYPGQSGHIHLSLRDKATDKSAFYQADAPHGMSQVQKHFLGGQQQLMPHFLAMVAPTINSYTRLIPGFWAPTHSTWGIENRTTALRLIPGQDKSQRLEYRIAAADANPYLALAAALASGLYGIEHQLEPSEPITGSAYDVDHPAQLALPKTLMEAAQNLRDSEAAHLLFGNEFVDHFASTREWETRQYNAHISDWELDRYFEII